MNSHTTNNLAKTRKSKARWRRTEVAIRERHRRLFLEPLEHRALLAVAVADFYDTPEDAPNYFSAAGVPDPNNEGEFLIPPGLLYNDIGSSLTAQLFAPPQYGDVTLYEDGSFAFTPLGNYNGIDTFTYRVTDDGGTTYSSTVVVKMNVTPTPDAPLAIGDSFSTFKNSAVSGNVLTNDIDGDGDKLSGALVTQPVHGSLQFSNGEFTYTPDTNYTGSDSFTYKSSDGELTSKETTVSISVLPPTPQVSNKSYYLIKNSPLVVNAAKGLLGGVYDPDDPSAELEVVLGSGPDHGTLTVNSDGSFTYTPDTDYVGNDSFGFQVANGEDISDEVNANIQVFNWNHAPHANDDGFDGAEDGVINGNVLGNDTDSDGPLALTATLVSGPSHGTVTLNPDGSFTYTPEENYSGPDSFTYLAEDGVSHSSFNDHLNPLAVVDLNVNSENDPPEAVDDFYSLVAGATLSINTPGILGNDTDPDGDTLTAILGTGPQHGTLASNADGSFSYSPNSGFTGKDEFSYQASDGSLTSQTATVSITVNPPGGSGPTANGDSYSTGVGETLNVGTPGLLTNDTDPENDPLSATVINEPDHGLLYMYGDGSFTYYPDSGFSGVDSFTYIADDGTTVSNEATVTITVGSGGPTNTAPTAMNDSYSTDENVALIITGAGVLGNDTDPENDSLTAGVIGGPSHGNLTLDNNGSFTYTPSENFSGSDSFTYVANDGTLDSNVATVSITVNAAPPPANTPPVANGESYSVDENAVLQVPAYGVLGNDTDADGDPLTAVLVSGPSNGGLSFSSDGSFTYTPNENFSGSDSFTYLANDGEANSDTVTVSLTINDLPPTPVANGDSYQTAEDGTLTVSAPGILSNDQGESLVVTLVSGPGNGTLSMNADGSFSYTPAANFFGYDSFSYQLAENVTASVNIEVTGVNDPPTVGGSQNFEGAEDSQIVAYGALHAGASDVDTDMWNVYPVIVSSPQHGTVDFSTYGSFVYTPHADYNGPDSFTFVLSDGVSQSDQATVSLTITPVNDQPVAVSDSFTLNEDDLCFTPWLLGNDTDPDGDTLQVSMVWGATNGYVTILSGGYVHYTPNLNFSGPDSFSYSVSDGNGGTASASVSVWVTEINDAPVANDDAYSVDEDGYLYVWASGVLGNDTDIDTNGPLVAQVQQWPQNGQLQLNYDGSFTYTPNANFNGTDAFTYQAYDFQTPSNTVTVTITVNPVNDPPQVSDESYTLNEDEPLSAVSLLWNDSDIEGDYLTTSLLDPPTHGTVTVDSSGYFTYTPAPNYNITLSNNTPDSFTYLVSDGYSQTMGTVTLIVAPLPEPPVSIYATYSSVLEGDSQATFVVARQYATTEPLTVFYHFPLEGSDIAKPNLDYEWLEGSVTIPANETSAPIVASIFDDGEDENPEAITLILIPNSDFYSIDTSFAQTIIVDNDLPIVSVEASDDDAGEEGNDGTFVVSRQGLTDQSLTVYFNVSSGVGTATPDGDYASLGNSVVIPAGSSSATIAVRVLTDSIDEGPEIVRLSLSSESSYFLGDSTATVTIVDNDLPTVTITATDSNAAEDDNTGTFVISRQTATSEPVLVYFTVDEGETSATSGIDYRSFGNSVIIPANETAATVTVSVAPDYEDESAETVTILLAPSLSYALANASATVTIADNDLPTLSISASAPNADEAGPASGHFLVSRDGDTTDALTLYYSIGGSAENGVDYYNEAGNTLENFLTIPAGQASATITIVPQADGEIEPPETVNLTLQSNPSEYTLSTSEAIVTIANDSPTVTISASDLQISETSTQSAITYTLSHDGSTNSAVIVHLTLGGLAQSGVDYDLSGISFTDGRGIATIPQGSSFVTFVLSPYDDTLAEGTEDVVVSVAESLSFAAITIGDDEPNVYINASDSEIEEDASGVVTYQVTTSSTESVTAVLTYLDHSEATNSLDFSFSGVTFTRVGNAGNQYEAIVQIPSGVSMSFALDPNEDDIFEGTENVSIMAGGATAMVAIQNKTGKPTVSLEHSKYFIKEQADHLPIRALLSRATSRDDSGKFRTVAMTATPSQGVFEVGDYRTVEKNMPFEEGNPDKDGIFIGDATERVFEIPIIAWSVDQPTERFKVELYDISDDLTVGMATATVSIVGIDLRADTNNDGVISAPLLGGAFTQDDVPGTTVEEDQHQKGLLKDSWTKVLVNVGDIADLAGFKVVFSKSTDSVGIYLTQDGVEISEDALVIGTNPIPAQIWVKGVSAGSSLVSGKIVDAAGEEFDIDTVKIGVVEVSKIQEVDFKDNLDLLSDPAASLSYTAESEWYDGNRNGSISDQGDRRYPIAYVRGSALKATGTVIASMGTFGQDWEQEVFGRVVASNGVTMTSSVQANVTATSITFDVDGTLPDAVNYLTDFSLSWQISLDHGASWVDVGTSKHVVYLTYAAPAAKAKLYHTVVHLGSVNAAGATSAQGVIDGAWTPFSGRGVNRVKLNANWEVATAAQLTYWGQWAEANARNSRGMSVEDLLENNDGKCESWAKLLTAVLAAQGITDDITLKMILPANLDGVFVQGIVIKNVTLGGRDWDTPFGKAWREIVSASSVPAQNNPNARVTFQNHVIVGIGSKLYDPSYGGDKYNSMAEWEAASLAGIGFIALTPQGQQIQWVLPNRPAIADVRTIDQ